MVRDHSGSHSDRYFTTVGPFKHRSPDYGKVGNCVYKYPPGKYKITIAHIDSNLNTPDYDNTAQLEKRYDDVTGLGKSAALFVTGNKEMLNPYDM